MNDDAKAAGAEALRDLLDNAVTTLIVNSYIDGLHTSGDYSGDDPEGELAGVKEALVYIRKQVERLSRLGVTASSVSSLYQSLKNLRSRIDDLGETDADGINRLVIELYTRMGRGQ